MVNTEAIQKLSDQIVKNFQPERIILFGSYAYGSPTEDSDVDLLVVLPYQGKGARKAAEILFLLTPLFLSISWLEHPSNLHNALPGMISS